MTATWVTRFVQCVTLAALVGCAPPAARSRPSPANEFGVIVGRLRTDSTGIPDSPFQIDGVGSGARTDANGSFVAHTRARTITITFPFLYDSLTLAPVQLPAGDTLVLDLEVKPATRPIGVPSPSTVSVSSSGLVRAVMTVIRPPGLLWIVDGRPRPESVDAPPDLSDLRISRIEVVPGGAKAASLYGSRAARGIAYVTTKREPR
jgi:hypothetical protein